MKLRFVTWNFNGLRPLRDQLRLLDEVDWDVLALLEVTERNWDELAAGLSSSYGYSLHLRPPVQGEGRGRAFGCAIFTRGQFQITECLLLTDAPLPERELIARISHPAGQFLVGNFSLPPGVGWSRLKADTAVTIAAWLKRRTEPVIVGIDANAPKIDHPDLARNEWWWPEEAVLLGADRDHDLRDVLREWLADHDEQFARRIRLRPNGPLELSFVRGNVAQGNPCRYDMILASPEFQVKHVEYWLADALAAGSDHGLVLADLALDRT